MFRALIFIVFLLLSGVQTTAQKDLCRIVDGKISMRIYRKWSKAEADSILKIFDMRGLNMDSLFKYHNLGSLHNEGWVISKKKRKYFELKKEIDNKKEIDWIDMPWSIDSAFTGTNTFTDQYFGFNQSEQGSIIEVNDSITRFTLKTGKNVQSVLLSGSFNNWSTSGEQMKLVNDMWVIDIKLRPGRHEYKFIIDGKWMKDSRNPARLDDHCGDYNSVYFKPNYTFKLVGPEANSKVILTGTFNNWDEKEIRMTLENGVWKASVFLPDNRYEYKFIVDGKWGEDPNNPNKIVNEHNTYNSVLEIGYREMVTIKLSGHFTAKKVILAGTFNDWNEQNTVMTKTADGWQTTLPLKKGFHKYKFIVDGNWILDQTSPVCASDVSEQQDHFIIVAPNHVFKLEGYSEAKTVFVTGSFCDWSLPGFALKKVDNNWELPFYLGQGKTTYKFVVDGKWMRDISNPLYEENGLDNDGNSIIWIN